MIRINLLPYHLRPIKRTPMPYILGVLVYVLAILAMGYMFVATQAKIADKRAELQGYTDELQKLDWVVKESKRLTDLKQQLAAKIITIDEIIKDRIVWSRQLWNLSRLAPDNVWYSGVKVIKKPFTERVMVVDQTTKKQVPKEVTVQRPMLQVSGYVVATQGAASDVSPLALATEQDPEFSSLFLLETSGLKDTEFEDQPVKSFVLEYSIRQGEARK